MAPVALSRSKRRGSTRAERRQRDKLARKQRAKNLSATLKQARGLHQSGQLADAEALYRTLIASHPEHADPRHAFGVLLLQTRRVEAALSELAHAAELAPRQADILNNLGEAKRLSGAVQDAAQCYRAALALEPGRIDALCNLSLVLKSTGRLGESESTLRDALHRAPTDLDLLLNLADLLNASERFEDALDCYDQAITLRPDHDAGHYGRAYALYALSRMDAAEHSARRATELMQDNGLAVELLARILVVRQQYDQASKSFVDLTERRYGRGASFAQPGAAARLRKTNPIKLRHDYEQLCHLRDIGAEQGLDDLIECYRQALVQCAERQSTVSFDIVELDITPLSRCHNRLLHQWYPDTQPQGAINPALDFAAIERQLLEGDEGLIYFDDFLTPEALAALQKFALVNSCWFKTDYGAEVGASPDTGFCCPLLMQIAGETRERFPTLLGQHFFATLWGLTFYENRPGLGRHIDDAAMTINFWVTPDDGNLDPTRGGLLYWNKQVTQAGFFDLSTSEKTSILDTLLAETDVQVKRVPYRCNRAMLFRSTVIHGTDDVQFSDTYAHRRMNITCLYGHSKAGSVENISSGG